MAIVQFKNPQNGYIEDYNTKKSPLWCFLLGPVYWLSRGNIFHAVISTISAFVTYGASQLIYPFFTNKINLKTYLVVFNRTVDILLEKGLIDENEAKSNRAAVRANIKAAG